MRQGFASNWVSTGLLGLFALAVSGHAHAQQFVAQLHAPEATKWRWAGTSLAIDANTFVTGAPESLRNADTSNCSTALPGYGAIAIYKKSGGTWNFAQKFWHDTTTTFNEFKFGNSISLRGNTLVVSAERQDFSSTIPNAGAFVVFTRPSPTADFTKLGTFFAPNPVSGGRLGETSGLASNTQFIAVGDPTSHSALVYRLQNNTVTFAYAVPLPVPARFSSMFITDSNVLLGTILGYPTLVAYSLGQSSFSTLNTAALARPNTVVTGAMSGDGNTVATVLNDGTSYFTQVANFASGSVTWVDTRLIAPGVAAPGSNTDYFPQRIGMKESAGFFVSFTGRPTPLLASYKFTFNGGTGHDYNYEGAFLPGSYPALTGISRRASAVAFNGTDLLVGDPDIDSGSTTGACNSSSNGGVDVFSMGPISAPGPSGSTKLQPWITAGTSNSGFTVASYSGYALIGQGNSPAEQGLQGQVTLYRQVGSTWEQLERYVDGLAGVDNRFLNSGFGAASAINYHALFIGASQGGDGTDDTGVVYEADAVNGAYEHGPLTRTLPLPATVGGGDEFGSSLALDTDTLLVGAVLGGPDVTRAGSAYVYTFSSASQSWGLRQELQPPASDIQPFLAFGAQVAVSGDYALVSAPLFDGQGFSQPGAVYVYHRVNGTFGFVQRLMAPQPSNFDDFGQTMAIANAGNYLAISGNNSGVHLFRLNGTSFVGDGAIALQGMQFAPVAMSNLGLLVATPSDGRVRRFSRVGNNNWALGGTLTGPANQVFGESIAMQDSAVLIGAPLSPVGSFTTGAGFATTFSNVR